MSWRVRILIFLLPIIKMVGIMRIWFCRLLILVEPVVPFPYIFLIEGMCVLVGTRIKFLFWLKSFGVFLPFPPINGGRFEVGLESFLVLETHWKLRF